MATTGSNFVEVTVSTLSGSAVATAPYLEALGPKEAMVSSQPTQPLGGSGSPVASKSVCVDRVLVDLSFTTLPAVGTPQPVPEAYGTQLGAYAKNGSVLLSLSGTTAQTISLVNTATNTPQSTAGDTVFANVNTLVFSNLGTGAVVITTGATNPAGLPTFNGTSAGFTVAAGSVAVFNSAANIAVNSGATNIVCTPAASTTLVVSIGGA
jgi:hypothetical protein